MAESEDTREKSSVPESEADVVFGEDDTGSNESAQDASRSNESASQQADPDAEPKNADQRNSDQTNSGDDGSNPSGGKSNKSRGDGGGDSGRKRRRRRRRRSRNRDKSGGGGGGQQQQQRRGGGGGGGGDEITGTYEGVLELHPKGYGFLRSDSRDYAAQDSDPFVSSSLIEKCGLREGVLIKGDVGPGARNQGPRLKEIETVDGNSVEDYQKIRHFDDKTPINPFEQIQLERGAKPITMRVMDLLTPIGKGQRALIVAPPRSGKTMLMQDMAESISENHPEIKLMVLLIDERPEEVTEMRRMVRGEVIASSMDREIESHIRVSQLIFERAKRLSEKGDDVVVLLDSITRLSRAFNKWSNSGRTGTGGLDVRALDIPRKMFGTARRFDEGGSLTVIGTALIETGSRMDESIFQEFKGTGNMELVLSRDLADRRIFPAIDIAKSGTRREEKLLAEDVLEGVTMLRRSLVSLSPVEAMEQLIKTLEKFPSNSEFLSRVRSIL